MKVSVPKPPPGLPFRSLLLGTKRQLCYILPEGKIKTSGCSAQKRRALARRLRTCWSELTGGLFGWHCKHLQHTATNELCRNYKGLQHPVSRFFPLCSVNFRSCNSEFNSTDTVSPSRFSGKYRIASLPTIILPVVGSKSIPFRIM